jgi:hypothetical protein
MIHKRRGELQADLNAIAGALQDCDYWEHKLDEIEKGIPLGDLIPGAVIEEVAEVVDP